MMVTALVARWWPHARRHHGLWGALVRLWRVAPRFHRMRWPRWGVGEAGALLNVLTSRNWGGFPCPNRHTAALESDFAAYHGATFGIACSSGTAALQTVYRALFLSPGDEIVVPATTFSSVAAAALDLGLKPVLVDVSPETLCLDPSAAESAIGPRTRALVAVHLGSQMCDLDALAEVCARTGIALIEDCAHAHGASWRGRGAGTHGIAGCFSFQTSKTMSAGEGGMILTNDSDIAARCRSLVDCGRSGTDAQVPQEVIGTNLRMTEFQAALLRRQLKRLPSESRRRAANAELLDSLLSASPSIQATSPLSAVTRRPMYGYTFRYRPTPAQPPLEGFFHALFLRGIPASPLLYPPLYLAPEYGRGDPRGAMLADGLPRCTVAEAARNDTVWLPHMLLLCSRVETERLARDILDCVAA